jgi:hypothetical protein
MGNAFQNGPDNLRDTEALKQKNRFKSIEANSLFGTTLHIRG